MSKVHPLHPIQIRIQIRIQIQVLSFLLLMMTRDSDVPESARHADGGAESDVSSLTSAEELLVAPTTDDDSDLNSDMEVVWVKSARGVWGMGHSFGNKLYFTSRIRIFLALLYCEGGPLRTLGSTAFTKQCFLTTFQNTCICYKILLASAICLGAKIPLFVLQCPSCMLSHTNVPQLFHCLFKAINPLLNTGCRAFTLVRGYHHSACIVARSLGETLTLPHPGVLYTVGKGRPYCDCTFLLFFIIW